jgi:hypothetical protein
MGLQEFSDLLGLWYLRSKSPGDWDFKGLPTASLDPYREGILPGTSNPARLVTREDSLAAFRRTDGLT